MKIFNKLTSLTLVLIMAFTCLASCNLFDSVESYKATVKTSFTSNDAAMAEAIAALEKSEVTLYVYGDNIQSVSSTKIDDITLDKIYTVYGTILYSNTTLTAEGRTVTEKEKASFAPEQRANFINKIGVGASIDVDDFNTVKENKIDNANVYTCSYIKDDAKASLVAMFAEKMGVIDADISLVNAEYYVEKIKDKPVSCILNTSFAIVLNGTTYNINMAIECDYDYDAKVEIKLPENVSEYIVTSVDDIFG